VLGCDGANSITRKVVGATMEDFNFEQQWLVVDVQTPEPLKVYDGVQQVCDHDRAGTFMPVVPGRYRWEFRLREGERADELTEADVLEKIGPWLHGVDVDKVSVVRKTGYTFRGVVADRWRKGRVFLVGDAAHQTPPFIGQGLCAGIRDADNLAWKVARVVTGQADDRLLDTYEAERRPYARRVVQLAIAIGWLMTGGTARTTPARHAVMRTVTRVPGVEERVVTGAWPAFRRGPLVNRGRRARGVGELCPQPTVTVDGSPVRLDALLGDNFAVLFRGHDATASFDGETRAYFDAIGTRFIRLDDLRSGADGLERVLDKAKANAILIRPDHIIAAAADHPDLRAWRKQLEAAGLRPALEGATR
jgi:3-(3-hydroxy-phenyl)propionate hydroxylase